MRRNKKLTAWGSVFIPALLLIGALPLAGCQQSDSLSGTVTYNGEPVENGMITFASADGSGPGFGAQIVDGKYTADKVRLGSHRAYVRGLTKAEKLSREQMLEIRKSAGKRAGLPVDYIPEDAEGNNQTFEIEGGAQTIDFDITGPPRPK
jgi:hypothetical protein